MKPILIVQHLSDDGPAYLARWLSGRGLTYEVCDSEAGQTFPERIDPYAALAILGGEMSANDELPALRRAEDLIRQAVDLGVPTIGHCLGGQLIARALGARVARMPAPEIGWHEVMVADTAPARDWFGKAGAHVVFHWHYETFELPAGAELLASSSMCPHQAYALGQHLGLQFHLEADAEKLSLWSNDRVLGTLAERYHGRGCVQDGATIRAGIRAHLAAQHALADRVYARWLEGSQTARR
jgi:GMP synthase (glutamine-hydrolysing)